MAIKGSLLPPHCIGRALQILFFHFAPLLWRLGYGNSGEDSRGTAGLTEEQRHAHAHHFFEIGKAFASQDSSHQAEALSAFQSAVDLNPRNSRAWHGLALIARRQHRNDEAMHLFGTSVELNPAHGSAQLSLAKQLVKGGRRMEALQPFSLAASLLPNDWKAQVSYAGALPDHGRAKLPEAEAHCRAALELGPDQLEVHTGLGYIVGADERHEEAAESFRQATQISPTNSQAHLNLGVALKSSLLMAEAENSFSRAVQLQPGNVDAWEERARALQQLSEVSSAVRSFNTARNLQPDRATVYEGLAHSLIHEKRIQEALDTLQKGVALNSRNDHSWLRMGHCLIALHRQSEAAVAFNESATLGGPTAYEAPLLLSLMLELVGKQEASCEAYALGMSRTPAHLAERVTKLASPRFDCPIAHQSTNWAPMVVPCVREDTECWNSEQRRTAADWSKENVCNVPGRFILAEPCELFHLRQMLLRARLLHCMHTGPHRQRHKDGSSRYQWERCFVPASNDSRNDKIVTLDGISFVATGEDSIPSQTTTAVQNALAEHGAFRLLLDTLQGEADDTWRAIEHSLHMLGALADSSSTQYVHQAKHRHHLRLRPNATVLIAAAFAKLAKAVSAVLPTSGAQSLLTELGGFITNPGARAQRWHRDFRHPGCETCSDACNIRNGSRRDECATCLQTHGNVPIGEDMAPVFSCQLFVTHEHGEGGYGGLEIVPGTHELGHRPHAKRNKNASESHGTLSLAGPPGTIVCYDGTLEHRGAPYPSREGRARVVLYLSVTGQGRPAWAGSAMSPDLVGLRLQDLIEGRAVPDSQSCMHEDEVLPHETQRLEL